jgi:hypothetical protein
MLCEPERQATRCDASPRVAHRCARAGSGNQREKEGTVPIRESTKRKIRAISQAARLLDEQRARTEALGDITRREAVVWRHSQDRRSC